MKTYQSGLNLTFRNMKSIQFTTKTGKKNGELMKLLIAENFDALFTFDKNLQYQQNFKKYTIPVLVLNATDNTYLTLSKMISKIKKALSRQLTPGPKILNE